MDFSKAKYKLSLYNIFHKDGDIQYIWNTYSNALLKLDNVGQKYICAFSGIDDNSDNFNLLKTNGFIVDEQLNEFGRVCLQEKQAFFTHNSEDIDIAIIPGMGCNCKCSYCFQATQATDRSGVMTPEIAEKVAEYICQQLNNNSNAKKLYIMWFGGEPLLYVKTMEIISRKLIEYTRQNNIEFTAGVPTNGLLLNEKNFALIKDLYVTEMQICVDGTRDTYCISKGVSPKDFDIVIDNICRVAGRIKLMIRLNIPNNDVKEAIAIADYLLTQHKLLGKCYVKFAYLCDYSLSPSAARKAYINYVQNYSQWADYIFDRYGSSQIASPERILKHCYRASMSRFCIGSNGELYKCLHSAGDETKIMGNVWQGRFFNDAESMFYSPADIPSKSKCSNCEYLPVCMGECVKDCLMGFLRNDCESDKKLWLKLKLLEGGVRI